MVTINNINLLPTSVKEKRKLKKLFLISFVYVVFIILLLNLMVTIGKNSLTQLFNDSTNIIDEEKFIESDKIYKELRELIDNSKFTSNFVEKNNTKKLINSQLIANILEKPQGKVYVDQLIGNSVEGRVEILGSCKAMEDVANFIEILTVNVSSFDVELNNFELVDGLYNFKLLLKHKDKKV